MYCSYYTLFKTESCLQGNIRLVGPSGPNTIEGRVEYCSNGVWGTIRSSGFDTRDGEVVCRQLGQQHPRKIVIDMQLAYYYDIAYIGVQVFNSNTSGPVLFVGCTGTENSLVHSSQHSTLTRNDGIHCFDM